MASSTFLKNPPSDLVDGPLLSDMGVVTVAQPEHPEALREAIEASPDREILDAGQTLDLCPVLLPDKVLGATWAPDAMAIDVAALHQAYVRGLRRNGGVIKIGVRVTDQRRIGTDWEIRTRSERQRCRVVVNAAGAWGDNVASMAGARPVRLSPLRRTVFTVMGPPGANRWPMVIDASHRFYFRPDGTQILCSPADETPSPPADARPAEVDVAIGIDRINAVTSLGIRHVRSSWAGLRTFSPDRTPVIGFDPDVDGFFSLVGQGSSGIQTSPAAARAAASLILGASLDADLVAAGLVASQISPRRFTRGEV